VYGERPGQDQGTVRFVVGAGDVGVELVVDLPYQLLEQVLDGDDALGAACRGGETRGPG